MELSVQWNNIIIIFWYRNWKIVKSFFSHRDYSKKSLQFLFWLVRNKCSWEKNDFTIFQFVLILWKLPQIESTLYPIIIELCTLQDIAHLTIFRSLLIIWLPMFAYFNLDTLRSFYPICRFVRIFCGKICVNIFAVVEHKVWLNCWSRGKPELLYNRCCRLKLAYIYIPSFVTISVLLLKAKNVYPSAHKRCDINPFPY